MAEQYVTAAESLKQMLWENYPNITDAIAIENKNFKNPQLATQVMDRLKAVFATVPGFLKKTKTAVENLASQRNSEYKKHHQKKSVLEDFSNDKLKIDYVKLAEELSEKPTLVPKDNLIGFTAFYRRKAGEARGMSMTAYGQTNVLDKTFPIEDAYNDIAKEWLLKNLEKQHEQLKTIAKSIGKFNREDVNLTNNPLTNEGFLSEESIITLLRWDSVDLWGKKITLNTQIVKYFLAECANESIGIQIDGITIEDYQQVVQEPTKMTFNASEATAQANIKKSDFSIGLAFGGGRKEEKKDQKEKTQWGEAPKTQWGDDGGSQWGVNNWIDVGDHVDGHIPPGGNVSSDNPWEVGGIPWKNPISKENPVWL